MPSEAGYHYILDYMKCPQQFYWRYVQGLVPKRQPRKPLFGKLIHKVLAGYLKGEFTPDDFAVRWEALMNTAYNKYESHEFAEEDLFRGVVLLKQYAKDYGDEVQQGKLYGVTFSDVEREFSIKTPAGFTITGQVDAIVNYPNTRRVIIDHKTTGWSISNLIASLEVTNQSTVYIALAKQNGFQDINSVVFNIMYQNKSSIKFARPEIYRTQTDIDRFMHQADITFKNISDNLNEPIDNWERRETSCFMYARRCEYLDLCKGSSFSLSKENFCSREEAEEEELDW